MNVTLNSQKSDLSNQEKSTDKFGSSSNDKLTIT